MFIEFLFQQIHTASNRKDGNPQDSRYYAGYIDGLMDVVRLIRNHLPQA
jgi:hypothetical protein